jgi:hypothetical protein
MKDPSLIKSFSVMEALSLDEAAFPHRSPLHKRSSSIKTTSNRSYRTQQTLAFRGK